MFKKIALAATVLVAGTNFTFAETYNPAVLENALTPIAKAQMKVGLTVYSQLCGGLTSDLAVQAINWVYGQKVDKATEDTMFSQATGWDQIDASAQAAFCKQLKASVDQIVEGWEKLPVAVDNRNHQVEDVKEVEPFAITKGRLTAQYGSMLQNVTVRNNTSENYSIVIIDCDFYNRGELVGTGKGSINNLMTDKTKGAAVYGLQIDKADKIECSIGTALASR